MRREPLPPDHPKIMRLRNFIEKYPHSIAYSSRTIQLADEILATQEGFGLFRKKRSLKALEELNKDLFQLTHILIDEGLDTSKPGSVQEWFKEARSNVYLQRAFPDFVGTLEAHELIKRYLDHVELPR